MLVYLSGVSIEIDLTHSGRIYPVALPQKQVRIVPDRIDNTRFDLRTVEQSVPDLLTLPLLCDSSKVFLIRCLMSLLNAISNTYQ